MIVINHEKLNEVARILRDIEIYVDRFTDSNFFPPENYDEEDVARFFFFITGIDHRTGTYEKPFEGYIDGLHLVGSDLLYHLAINKFLEKPENFAPDKLSELSISTFKSWFSVNSGNGTMRDINTRVLLIRDLARKLIKVYDGKVTNLIKESGGYLYTSDASGFIDRLKIFKAYSDPVEKKSFLLAKFLERRGLLEIRDRENINVPVDNHLMRIAVRLGIVKPIGSMEKYFTSWSIEADKELDIVFRLIARRAYRFLANIADISPFILDDFLWKLGREKCMFNSPKCSEDASIGSTKTCPFIDICEQYLRRKTVILNEHKFLNTWYY